MTANCVKPDLRLDEFDQDALPPGTRITAWATVALRADGGAWRLPVLAMRGASDGPTLLVLAGVHGDEYEGVEAIPLAFGDLQPDALRGTLILVPVCNLPAYVAAQRNSPVDGLNLARVFPGKANGTLTERIAHWLTANLLHRADFMLDLHSGGAHYDLPTLVGYIHDAGALGQRSLAAARAFGAPVLWGHPLPLPPGRSIAAATSLGIPALYTEASGGGYARPDDVACYRRGIHNLLCHLGMLDGTPQTPPVTHHLLGDGNLDQVISAPVAGYFRAAVELLQEVTAGQPLGTLYDLFGANVADITAPADGVVILLRRFHRVHAGEGLAQITQFAPP